MKHPSVKELVGRIADVLRGHETIRLMEVCGTHTVSLFRSGIKSLLPENLKLISGPGCPVCVTSQAYLDVACELAARPDVTICTYGDMVRVPGKTVSLEQQRAEGARVVVVYSARDAVQYAIEHPKEHVVFLGVGFETTTPATALAVIDAEDKGVENFSILPGHKLVIPAMLTLLSGGEVAVDAFICPGHVSIIIGTEAYRPIVEQYGKSCIVTGFEPEQMLEGICELVKCVVSGKPTLGNVYGVAVGDKGNEIALGLIDQVFQPGDAVWRAMGTIPGSGLDLREKYQQFDTMRRFDMQFGEDYEPVGCRCGEVIQGLVEPIECPLFGKTCTPMKPIGPCMVSSEGTCAAWYKYNRNAATS